MPVDLNVMRDNPALIDWFLAQSEGHNVYFNGGTGLWHFAPAQFSEEESWSPTTDGRIIAPWAEEFLVETTSYRPITSIVVAQHQFHWAACAYGKLASACTADTKLKAEALCIAVVKNGCRRLFEIPSHVLELVVPKLTDEESKPDE